MTLEAQLLHAGPLVRVLDVRCAAPASGPGAEEHNPAADVLLPRRGVFAVHRGRDTLVAGAGVALVLGAAESYRVSHPAGGGDRCTVLRFAPAVHEEAFGDLGTRMHGAPLRPPPAGEEDALLLFADVAAAPLTPGPAAARRAGAVRALLAADPGRAWSLAGVAAEVHCSPFHLARQFRAATGTTIGRHLLRLRLSLALDRLEQGEDDLARLAADLGFAGHSHLTARFREAFGRPPSQMRKTLTARRRRRA
ncbi:MAG TPA: AraC family transcriptional regulator [Solirubrobacteraceae bacterium]|nr:AraC family transcriptional regulator [Solirubrobacteraceae bacterium]